MSENEKVDTLSIEYMDIIEEISSYQILIRTAIALIENQFDEVMTDDQKRSNACTLMFLYLDKVEEMKSKASELHLMSKGIS
jgi:hypothetical protein